jgi:hypothetical protein
MHTESTRNESKVNEKGNEESSSHIVATIEEIRTCIEAMSPTDLIKLERYARYRIRGLGRRAEGRDHEDLLKEAMAMTLAGQRHWKKNRISFLVHLFGVMRSISSHWGEKSSQVKVYLDSELAEHSLNEQSILDQTASDIPDTERVFSAKEKLLQIYERFKDDLGVINILNGFANSYASQQIQEVYNMTKKEYEAALRRLRRGITAITD